MIQDQDLEKTQDLGQPIPEAKEADTLEEQDILAKALAESQQDLADQKSRNLRLLADFDNYTKRLHKEQATNLENSKHKLFKNMLPVLDGFDRALVMCPSNSDIDQAVYAGMQLIHDQLQKVLENEGLKPIPVQANDAFNPELHEVIMQVPVEEAKQKGKIVAVVDKGYWLHHRVLRFAKVTIGV